MKTLLESWQLDISNLLTVPYDRRFRRLGLSEEPVLPVTYDVFLERLYTEDLTEVYDQFLALISVAVDTCEYTYRIRLTDGGYAVFEDQITIVAYNSNGMPLMAEGVTYDLSLSAKDPVLNKIPERDPLTFLKTSDAFVNELKQSIDKQSKSMVFLTTAMICVDNFAQINSIEKRSVADRVLVNVAHAIEDALPEEAYTARFGVNCFIIALPNTPNIMAETIIKNILDDIQSVAYAVEPKPIFSYGLKEYLGETPYELIQTLKIKIKQAF